MKITTLCRLALLGAPALLIWPATAPWADTNPNFNPNVTATTPDGDFTLDNTNGTAYHQKTGLTWKRCAEGQTWNSGSCTGSASYYTWSLALQRGPANDGFAGFNDWRLPNQKELNSIVEQRNWSPAINATVFPNTPTSSPAYVFWSASPFAPAGRAWVVAFGVGNDYASYRSLSFAVRLVRGGQYSLLSVTRAGAGSGAVSSNLPGVDCGNFCKGSFANEMFGAGQVVLTATPDANSTFGGWTNCPSASGNQCTVNSAGDRAVTATFMGNTTTAITNDTPDPSAVGQIVTVSYTVAAVAGTGTPTGNVTVSDGTVNCTGTVAAGTCTLTFTSAGAKTLTATYAGDSNFNGSASAGELHTVNKANTTTTITSDTPDPSAVGQTVAVNFTVAAVTVTAANATVQVVNGGGPTGNVTVSDGADSCTATVAAGTCNLTFTSAGAKTLTATYAGDANFNPSTSAGAPHEVLARTAQGNTSGGLVTAAITGGTCVGFANGSTHFPAPPVPPPAGVTFPYGLFGFTAAGCTGQPGSVTLTVTYPDNLPPGTQYWKYGPTADNHADHWYLLPAQITDNIATFAITDGGLGDDDLAANGSIVDQGGPGAPGAGDGATGIPTLSTGGLLLFSALLGLLGFRRSRYQV